MQRVRLANFVLSLNEQTACYPEMVYRTSGAVDYAATENSLAFEGRVDFTTYFNALSLAKWRKYTVVEGVWLHIELVGDPCVLSFRTEGRIPDGEKNTYPERVCRLNAYHFLGSSDYTSLDLCIPEGDFTLVGVELESEGATAIQSAYWFAEVPEGDVRPVHIAIATTTFRKEEYITANVAALEESIFAAGSDLKDDFHMYVIDNGRTLDWGSRAADGITVISNANVGGAGGFARGMLAALRRERLDEDARDFTHVLLMDDDIKVFPESLVRTHGLLRLLNDEYAGAFLNGAMLSMQQPNLQFEDVAHVTRMGVYTRVKSDLHIDEIEDATRNEEIDVEVPDAYGAWWYSCIPVSAIRQNGLPLPLFVRCDDVEFGLRNHAKYMTMNGICVWHDSFQDKFNATMAYQSYRNQLIMDAMHGKEAKSMVPFVIERALRTHLRNLNYDAADLIVTSMEDYLMGPDFIMSQNPESLLREHNARCEKLVPLPQAIAEASDSRPDMREKLGGFTPDLSALQEKTSRSQLPIKAVRLLPYDKHLLPDVLLRDDPATIYVGESQSPNVSHVATRVLVACDRSGQNAHVRFMNRKRYCKIRNRWRKALAAFRETEPAMRKAYRGAMPTMASVEFWEDYLSRANKATMKGPVT